jgi:phosphopantothenoylcysteine decarboxylase/phosphopantothenate--cysteine ligase
MAEPDVILEFLAAVCNSGFAGLRVLVSVGGTEEDLDPVRVITNRSSGRMGFALAEAARNRGALVTAVTGRVSVPAPVGVRIVPVRTSADMSRALNEHFADSDVLIMAAAVSDFAPASPLGQKQKGGAWSIELRRTQDILASLGKKKKNQYVIGFALETENLETNSKAKLAAKKCDMIVVNNPLEEGAGFEHETNVVTIYNAGGKVLSTGLKSKPEIADVILQTALEEDAFRQLAK